MFRAAERVKVVSSLLEHEFVIEAKITIAVYYFFGTVECIQDEGGQETKWMVFCQFQSRPNYIFESIAQRYKP